AVLYVPLHSSALALFLFNATAPAEIYTLSLHDALPICVHADHAHAHVLGEHRHHLVALLPAQQARVHEHAGELVADRLVQQRRRSEEHTSELQSRENLVCRLLLEKKKKISTSIERPAAT